MKHRTQSLSSVLLMLALAAAGVASAPEASAQEDSARVNSETTERRPSSARPKELSPEQSDKAMEFARQHHPELADLLRKLRTNSPNGFSRGIREVHRTVVRLERLQDKQPARHASELQKWKTDSRIQLMTAQWAMTQDPALEQQIRDLLLERQQIRLERLSADRDKLLQRLKQLDDQIERASAEDHLNREWERLQKRAKAGAGAQRSKKKQKKNPGSE